MEKPRERKGVGLDRKDRKTERLARSHRTSLSFRCPSLKLERMDASGIDDLARETALAVRRETGDEAGLAVGVEELGVRGRGGGGAGGVRRGELDEGEADLDAEGLARRAVVRDEEVDLEDVGDVEEGRGVVRVRGAAVEVDGDGDRRRRGLEAVARVALLHEEGVGVVRVGHVVGLHAGRVRREGDAVLGEEHELVGAEERHFRRLLARGWERERAGGIGRREIGRALGELDGEAVHAHTRDCRSQLDTQVKLLIRNVQVARHMQLRQDRARNVRRKMRRRRILQTWRDRV